MKINIKYTSASNSKTKKTSGHCSPGKMMDGRTLSLLYLPACVACLDMEWHGALWLVGGRVPIWGSARSLVERSRLGYQPNLGTRENTETLIRFQG